MKIMHVIESLGVGGAEQLLVALLPALQQLGNDVLVVVRTDRLDLKAALNEAGVPVIQLPRRHKWNLIGAAVNIARIAEQYRVDIIHAHLYFPAQSTALVKLLRLHSAATVITFHNLAYAEGVNKKGIGLTVKRVLASLLYPKGFDQKTAVSNAVAAHYRSSLGLDAIEVIHNPVDIHLIDRLERHGHQKAAHSMHIVMPGRLVHEKGQADLIDALAILRDQEIPFTATMVGDGPMRSELETKARSVGLESVVLFAGRVKHDSLLKIVATADIVVMPSHSEGFPLAALEAMALSRPMIVTAVGGLVEIVENEVSGIVVPAKKPADLARAMDRLISSSVLRETLGKAGRTRVEQEFALPRIAQQMHALYEETVTLNQAGKICPSSK